MRHDGYSARVKMDLDEQKMAERVDPLMSVGKQRYSRYFPELSAIPTSMSGFVEKEAGHNNIALLGDSHADVLLPGLLINEGMNDGVAAFMTNCAIPLMGVQSGFSKSLGARWETHRFNYKIIAKGFDYVLSHPEINKVILTNFPGCFQLWGVRSLDNPALTAPEQILSDGISRTFKALSEAGKEVVWVLDVPTFSHDGLDRSKIDACAAKVGSIHSLALPLRSALYLSKDKASIDEYCTIPESDNGSKESHDLLKKLIENEAEKYNNIHVVDLTPVFCQDQTCSMIKNGKMVFLDSSHVNRAGAAIVAPLVFNAFDD